MQTEVLEVDQITVARQHLTSSHGSDAQITIDGAIIHLSSLDKMLWPGNDTSPAISKRQLIDYYLKVAPALLPQLVDRPLTIKRFPEGIAGPAVFQRHITDGPDYVQTVDICVDSSGTNQPFLLCQNAATLVWLANLDTIEFHPWYSRINPDGTSLPTIFINSIGTLEMSVLNYPDWLVIDVDANQEDTQLSDQVQQGALLIHDYLQQRSIAHAAKVSGQGGLHIVVPIQRLYPYEQVRQAARRLCQQVADQHDELFTTEWHMDKRQGRIFLDWQQNARGKSLVAPYSLRATPEATASWPISWDILASQEPFHPTLLTTPKVEDDAWDNQTPQELPAEWLT